MLIIFFSPDYIYTVTKSCQISPLNVLLYIHHVLLTYSNHEVVLTTFSSPD